ncbi:Por secretion system C-terminal sorting domain-containing protein [Lutibacter agarilyticus]|uniref:Por secretion system C-terminal sorting domain-containing protein n=1 Tax=Lutibacter agarilyticus TaxID=1109740 RepID=A0A238XH34_9FLAO|nr:CUB domain-containing protein [Lutibacter agarilyticus]SNR57908.1 Por secretion system C-terminal sorting domain-containing protein [Lutibacter agarilyticus]
MKKNHIKPLGIILLILISSYSFGQVKQQSAPKFKNPFQSKSTKDTAQIKSPIIGNKTVPIPQGKPKIKLDNGSFSVNLKKDKLAKATALKEFSAWLPMNDSKYSFEQVSEKTDKLGYTHTNLQQFYNGYPIEGKVVMLHSKNNMVTAMNGQLSDLPTIKTMSTITSVQATEIAKNYLNVTELIQEYPVEKVITQISGSEKKETRLAYKIRIDSNAPFMMYHVYIDAETAVVLKKVSLIAHTDTPGTGKTLYSGTQDITIDSYSGGYRLREQGRKIETYDATNATFVNNTGFTGSSDYVSSSTDWVGVSRLSSFSISAVSKTWWYAAFADQIPDLYIVIKDASNQKVYTSKYVSDANPPLTFNNINLNLTNGPYKVEIWDYDTFGGDDFGGSYIISADVGTGSWSGSGNVGTYEVVTSSLASLDVHWGMEQTYDFYLNVFGRDSYDGLGSVIKQYINPPALQSEKGESPNNAYAMPAPYNMMAYGLGDGVRMNPVVGLDVEGHEFTHMVVDNNGNGGLAYEGESGALNESFADIFGVSVEFYSGVNPDWFMGEDIMVSEPFLRSMSNPNDSNGPDTYNGTHWVDPSNLDYDHGGVHTNSGVQNFWFYLLSEGGTGTNDLGNPYAVTGIGISEAQQITYRNLITYLGSNATYLDAYYGSLQAAEDLYGNGSVQYNSVREAWYAVGIGNDASDSCSGVIELTEVSGTVTDGSGSSNYINNANCTWVIAPAGASQISLDFTELNTELNFDTVYLYDGPDETYPVIATLTGTVLPSTITTTLGVGAMCIKFVSDAYTTSSGWSANYTTIIKEGETCHGSTVFASNSGSFRVGSDISGYGNNQNCYYFISPPCAESVTLSFSEFDTELDYDGVIIYDDWEGNNQLAVYSGISIPASVTSNTGQMLVIFVSDHSNIMKGFSADYTSTGADNYGEITVLNTTDYGIISDGSGLNNYCNNQENSWLIQPPQATSITLTFTEFAVEEASSDGATIYDVVEVYDGATTSSTLLGRFTGANLPPVITSSGSSLLVRFNSDLDINDKGWEAYYTSTQNSYCSNGIVLSAANGTFSDGSNTDNYTNNSICSWLIQPSNTSSISLSFTEFNTEIDYDGVVVYDGADSSAPILGQFSGTSLPPSINSTGGVMYIEFLSDIANREQGWTASYTSTSTLGISDSFFKSNLKVFPNPSDGIFTIKSNFNEPVNFEMFDVLGREVLKMNKLDIGINEINATKLSSGTYLIKFTNEYGSYIEKLIIN